MDSEPSTSDEEFLAESGEEESLSESGEEESLSESSVSSLGDWSYHEKLFSDCL